jgi:polyadenylation factor subunit 2
MSGEDAEQEAAERNLIRRCVDYHGPATIDLQDRLYRKACRSHHVRNYKYLHPHSSYLRLMGMPISKASAPVASEFYLTYCAHITRAKNSTPIICLSWTPGGRRLLTGNNEGEFTLWDGSKLSASRFDPRLWIWISVYI